MDNRFTYIVTLINLEQLELIKVVLICGHIHDSEYYNEESVNKSLFAILNTEKYFKETHKIVKVEELSCACIIV